MSKKTEEQNDGTQCLTSDAPYKLSPRAPRLGAMLLDQPLAGPTQLQPCAVHQQVHGLGIVTIVGSAAQPWAGHLQGGGPAAQGGVVRHREIKAQQAHEGTDQALGLPE